MAGSQKQGSRVNIDTVTVLGDTFKVLCSGARPHSSSGARPHSSSRLPAGPAPAGLRTVRVLIGHVPYYSGIGRLLFGCTAGLLASKPTPPSTNVHPIAYLLKYVH